MQTDPLQAQLNAERFNADETLANTIHNAVEHMKNLAHQWECRVSNLEMLEPESIYCRLFARDLRNHAQNFAAMSSGPPPAQEPCDPPSYVIAEPPQIGKAVAYRLVGPDGNPCPAFGKWVEAGYWESCAALTMVMRPGSYYEYAYTQPEGDK